MSGSVVEARGRLPAQVPHGGTRDTVRAYLALKGVGGADAARLLAGYTASFVRKFAAPRTYHCVGESIPGASRLSVRFEGMPVFVRPGTNDLDLLVHHEPRSRAWFAVRPGEVVVDVGAHIGLYTLLAAKAGASVLAIEPDPENRALLEANVERNRLRDVQVVPVAVSDRSGMVALRRPGGPNRGTTSLVLPAEGVLVASSRDVQVRREPLDRIVGQCGLDRVDWLKVDVEGHEIAALEGGRDTLRRTRRLLLEVTSATAEACRRLTREQGFRLVAEEPGFPASNWLMERDGA